MFWTNLERVWWWTETILRARFFLVSQNLITSVFQLPPYLDFSKRVFFHIRNLGWKNAVDPAKTERDLFLSYGLDRNILNSLALLQGLDISGS